MKKLLFALFISFFSMSLMAQTKVTSDDHVTISSYVGILNTTSFELGSLNVQDYYSLRVGALADWEVSNFLNAKGFAVYDHSYGNACAINSFSLNLHTANQGLSLEFGKMATLSTEHRPVPPSADSQFETWAQARVPGSAVGAKLKMEIGKNVAGVGINVRDNEPEYHLRFNTQVLTTAACYTTSSGRFQTSAALSSGRVYSLAVFETVNNTQLFANLTNVKLSKKLDVDLYSDFGYQIDANEVVRWEIGLYKNFQAGIIKGMFCVGYVYEQEVISAYLFIHI